MTRQTKDHVGLTPKQRDALHIAISYARARGVRRVIAYHDRSRHTGSIYRKAGFRRDGVTAPKPGAWASRPGRLSGGYEATPKRRWAFDIEVTS